MRVIVAGNLRSGVMLDTDKASAVLISTDDGEPNVIFKMMENGQGWVRLTDGEDVNFAAEARNLGLLK